MMVRDCLEWDTDEIITICVMELFILSLDVAGLKAGGLFWGPQIWTNKIKWCLKSKQNGKYRHTLSYIISSVKSVVFQELS